MEDGRVEKAKKMGRRLFWFWPSRCELCEGVVDHAGTIIGLIKLQIKVGGSQIFKEDGKRLKVMLQCVKL